MKRGQATQISGLAAAVPLYILCLEDVDELMSLVFKASVNPGFFTGSLKKEAKRFLSEENEWPLASGAYLPPSLLLNSARVISYIGGFARDGPRQP